MRIELEGSLFNRVCHFRHCQSSPAFWRNVAGPTAKGANEPSQRINYHENALSPAHHASPPPTLSLVISEVGRPNLLLLSPLLDPKRCRDQGAFADAVEGEGGRGILDMANNASGSLGLFWKDQMGGMNRTASTFDAS